MNRLANRFYPCHISRVAQFDLHQLREIADEGIARHGLRGYARKLGLDVSTMRSLRDGRDMQISKVMEVVAALDLSLELRPAGGGTGAAATGESPELAGRSLVPVPFHEGTARPGAAHIAFSADWLNEQGWQAAQLRCVLVADPGADRCVQPGALCLLDCARNWPGQHAIWAYLDGTSLRVSYLSRPDAGVLLISGRDPNEPTRHVTGPALDAITPLGRVVWTGALLTDIR